MYYARKNLSFIEYMTSRLQDIFGCDDPEDIYDAEQTAMNIIDEYYEESDDTWFFDDDEDDEEELEEPFHVETIGDDK